MKPFSFRLLCCLQAGYWVKPKLRQMSQRSSIVFPSAEWDIPKRSHMSPNAELNADLTSVEHTHSVSELGDSEAEAELLRTQSSNQGLGAVAAPVSLSLFLSSCALPPAKRFSCACCWIVWAWSSFRFCPHLSSAKLSCPSCPHFFSAWLAFCVLTSRDTTTKLFNAVSPLVAVISFLDTYLELLEPACLLPASSKSSGYATSPYLSI